MSCFKPLKAYQMQNGTITFQTSNKGYSPEQKYKNTHAGVEIKLPCGRCIGCRLDRAKNWAVRCMHEASLHEENCFITLTYNAENLPPDCGLIKRDYVNFVKRLRKSLGKKKIKYYMCGEYGDKNNRPHYHAIIFGHNFNDWQYLFDSPSGEPIYTSPTLEQIWKYGFVTVGTVSYESAAYVARYCLKKINGPLADKIDNETGLKHYERINSFTGEISEVMPEYSTMSRGGRGGRGLGYDWIATYTSDVYPKDYTTINGRKMCSNRYYDKYLNEIDPDMYDDIKAGRLLSMAKSLDNTEPRLLAREKVKEAQNQLLKRSI